MIFRSATFLSVVCSASAVGSVEIPTADIPASSKLGSRLLSQARQLDQNNNFAWVTGYSLKFQRCAISDDFYGGYFGGEEGGNGGQNFNGMYKQRLIHFKLCPSNDCDSCTYGADYVIDMNLFVEAYIESKMEAQEYNCEMVKENCYCDDANDDEMCERQCYYNAGLDYCEENQNQNQNGQEEFRLEEAAECQELDVDEDALQYYYYSEGANNNQQQYYYGGNGQNGGQEMKLFVGPYCSDDGKSIHLGTFMDEWCSYPTPSGTYEKFNYGQALPFSSSSESLIEDGCVSCKEPQDANDQNNGDQQDEDEVLEVCERLYEDAGKCEEGLESGVTYYPNTYACEFIKTLKAPGKMSTGKSIVAASKVFAGLFAATTVVFAGVSYHLHQKAKRQNVQLSSTDGGTLA